MILKSLYFSTYSNNVWFHWMFFLMFNNFKDIFLIFSCFNILVLLVQLCWLSAFSSCHLLFQFYILISFYSRFVINNYYHYIIFLNWQIISYFAFLLTWSALFNWYSIFFNFWWCLWAVTVFSWTKYFLDILSFLITLNNLLLE